MTVLYSEAEVASVLTEQLTFDAAREAYELLARGEGTNMPRRRGSAANATLNLMGALAPTLGALGVKAYPVVRSDITLGAAFTVQLFDSNTGELVAILAGNNLGNRRTAAASAVATVAMARPDSQVLTVFGAGWVATAQAIAVAAAMPSLERILVVGRSPANLAAFAAEVSAATGLSVAASDAEPAVRAADVIITATGASEPVFDGTWLQHGTHIVAAGSNLASKRELDDAALRAADLIAVDNLEVARLESGDLLRFADGWPEGIVELGDILIGTAQGRTGDDQITLFESQGVAMLDVVLAARVLPLLREHGLGTDIGLLLAK